VPATFPSHAAAVLPLKVRWPRRLDGVALVTGSAAPDLYYGLNGYVVVPPTHNVPGLFWFTLPVALVATALIRRSAPTIAAHLPGRPAWLALRDYGVLGTVRHKWYVTAYSILLGGLTHIAWDGFTHAPGTQHGWAVRLAPALRVEAWPGTPWWLVAQHASTVLGAVVAAAHPLTWPLLRFRYATYVQGVRMIWCVALALLAGAAVAHLVARVRAERAR
jgi:hypothetical protein